MCGKLIELVVPSPPGRWYDSEGLRANLPQGGFVLPPRFRSKAFMAAQIPQMLGYATVDHGIYLWHECHVNSVPLKLKRTAAKCVQPLPCLERSTPIATASNSQLCCEGRRHIPIIIPSGPEPLSRRLRAPQL